MSWDNKIYFLLLIFIPIILVSGVLFFRNKAKNLNLPVGDYFNNLKIGVSYTKQYIKFIFFILSLIAIVISLASPMYGESSKMVQKNGIDIVIALDISKSMLAEDIAPSRIERAKMEISSFIKTLKGDRVGLVSFAGIAYPQAPLTTDYSVTQLFLKNISVDDIPINGTNIQLAIETAADLFEMGSRGDSRSRVLILVSDGENHDGDLDKAAKMAQEKHIQIYTIGIGSLTGELIPIKDKKGVSNGYLENKGEPVLTKLNPDFLTEISALTNGKYYGFQDNSIDLSKMLGEISQLEKKSIKEEFKIMKQERFTIPLYFALFFLLLSSFIGERRRKHV